MTADTPERRHLRGYFTARWLEEHFPAEGNLGMIFTGNGIHLFRRF